MRISDGGGDGSHDDDDGDGDDDGDESQVHKTPSLRRQGRGPSGKKQVRGGDNDDGGGGDDDETDRFLFISHTYHDMIIIFNDSRTNLTL
jgi:hypothetical protein